MTLSRRELIAGTGAVAFAAAVRPAGAWEATQRFPDPAVEIIDPSFAKYRFALTGVERVATGLRWGEGPVWFGDMRQLLLSDVSNNRIMRWDEETGQLSVFRQPSNYANGNTRDRQGRLLTCEGLTRRITRTEHDGTITVLLDQVDGKPLNSPNDIVCKSDGSIWFTDPGFGPSLHEGILPPVTGDRVYRLDPETKKAQIVASDIRGPNGLCFSPDETKLYVIESRAKPSRLILVYDVVANGTGIDNKRTFYDCGDGTADGFRADVDGNLWCGWGMGEANDGVIVLSPAGKPIGRIRLPERCANLCFGGANRDRLFMAASHSIYALSVNVQGAPGG